MKLENELDQLMALAAVRYCLGRNSYIVGSCLDWLRRVWDQVDESTRTTILRDVIEEVAFTSADPASSTEGWRGFAQEKYPLLSEPWRGWIRADLDWHNVPWPLREAERVEGIAKKMEDGGIANRRSEEACNE